jgi:thiosulfate/3-mercaptopyruvate sulfurtransferase
MTTTIPKWRATLALYLVPGIVLSVASPCSADLATKESNEANEKGVAMLIEPAQLAKRLSETNLRILDARSKEDYTMGHIPGAVWVDVSSWQKLARSPGGLHDAKAWAEKVGQLGIDRDIKVVVYGSALPDTGRVWWMLKYLGVPQVMLLNGGWSAWNDEKLATETTVPTITTTQYEVRFDADRLEEIDSLKTGLKAGTVKVVDTRSKDEFTGKEVRGKRGGHVAGATHLEWKELLSADGRFKPREQLQELFRGRGILPDETAVCY